jgi:hypothetical protein
MEESQTQGIGGCVRRMNNRTNKFLFTCFLYLLIFFIGCDNGTDTRQGNEQGISEPVRENTMEEDESTGEINLPAPKEISEEDISRNWPEDIPLMEPYTIHNFMSSEAFTQLVIVVPESAEVVVQYYVDNLEASGWETHGDMHGAPPVMISWQCRKDDRELDIMIRYDSRQEASFVTLRLDLSSGEDEE